MTMTHYYVTDNTSNVLSDAFNNANNAHEAGARIREERGVETFVRAGHWSSWKGAPSASDRCVGQAEIDAQNAAVAADLARG
jgi:hypothetical protein